MEKKKETREMVALEKLSIDTSKIEFRESASLGRKLEPSEKTRIEKLRVELLEKEMDKKIVDKIEILYGQWIPPERIAEARRQNVQFQEDKEFQAELKSRLSLQESEAKQVVGFESGSDVRVERNVEAPATLVHERFHSLSHPEARKVLGTHLYEGLTEELASRESDFQMPLYSYEKAGDGVIRIESPREYYSENRATLSLIMARAPESALLEAYFQGNDARLEAFVDHECGKGAWEKVKELLEKVENDKDTQALRRAREILGGGS